MENRLRAIITRLSLWQIMALGCGLLWLIMFLDIVPTGDDLSYASIFHGNEPYHEGNPIYYPRWILSHWLHANGRLPNYIAPLAISLPQTLRAAVVGLGVWALMYLAVKASGISKGWIPCALIACLTCFLPWWDYFTLVDVHANYTWSCAMTLLFYIILTGKRRINIWLGGGISLLAGCCHEAASLPLLGAIIVYLFITRQQPSTYDRTLVVCFAIGTFAVVFSPGIIARAASSRTADDTPLILFLKSDIIAGILWLFIIISYVFKRGRTRINAFFHRPVSILAWAALASSLISVAGGIVGRSGFFAETFALIVIFSQFPYRHRAAKPVFSLLLMIIVFVFLGNAAYWQHCFGKEQREAWYKYLSSHDGIVYMQITPDDEAPKFLTLGIPRGVPDSDDLYLLHTMTLYHPTAKWPYLVDLSKSTICDSTDSAWQLHPVVNDWHELYYIQSHSTYFTVEPFHGKILIRRLVLDPGDRIRKQ